VLAARLAPPAADPASYRKRGLPASAPAQSGFTLLELTITMVILTAITLLVERTLSITHDTDLHLDARQAAQHRGSEVAFEIHRGVASSRRIFARGAVGNAYAAALDLTRAPPISSVRLPLPDEAGSLAPDALGDPRTGNALLFVREAEPVGCPTDAVNGPSRLIDVYRFVCWYPRPTDRRLVPEAARSALDLVVWRSIGYPAYRQLMAIEDVDERRRVVQHLYEELGHRHAWDPNESVDHAFYALDLVGTIANFPTTAFRIREDVDRSEGSRLVYADVQLARTDPTSAVKRAVLTTDDPSSWVPDGFEVKVAGPSGHRQVWIHVTVEAPAGRGRTAAYATTLVASARDL
jgi:prepilin-type N-terminal cleavage/methylation domain-containing protein